MGYSDKALKGAANGKPAQYYDSLLDDFRVAEGDEHGQFTQDRLVLDKLTDILNKIIAAPATADKQDTQISKLDLVLSSLATAATSVKQDVQATKLDSILAALPATISGTLLASAQRTASLTTPTQFNKRAKGVIVSLQITETTGGGGGIRPRFSFFNPVSISYEFVNAAPDYIASVGKYFFVIYPGALTHEQVNGNAIKQCLSLPLPEMWNVYVQHADANPYTYSLGYNYIL